MNHSADYISFPLGSLGPWWCIWKWTSAFVYARGRKQCCKLRYCLWRVSIKPGLPFSNPYCILCFQRQSFWRLFYYTVAGVSVAASERLLVHHQCRLYFISFGIIGPMVVYLKIAHVYARGRKQCCKLHYCLWRDSIKPSLTFSNPKCVLSFQRQFFLTFILLHCSWC